MAIDFMHRIDVLREKHLTDVMDLLDRTVGEVSPAGSSLVEMTRYHLSTGGKRLRALLPLATAEALGVDAARLVPFAASCEILHNATLVHDDLQDGDTVRRGLPTIWAKFGDARAINLGDAMLYYTLALSRKLEGTAEQRERLNDRIVRETIRVIDGQEREFLLQTMERPSESDYFAMVEGKTSGLFALPVAGAALFCGASTEIVEALERATGHLGVLFQIQDDVLDLYGDKGRDKKGSDVGEGKISILVVHALANAPEADASWLRALLRRERDEVSDADIERVSELFKTTGSLANALQEINRRTELAVNEPALQDTPLRDLLAAMADVFVAPIKEQFDWAR
jgi:geranylgeranyl diphosphate synthase type I